MLGLEVLLTSLAVSKSAYTVTQHALWLQGLAKPDQVYANGIDEVWFSGTTVGRRMSKQSCVRVCFWVHYEGSPQRTGTAQGLPTVFKNWLTWTSTLPN